MGNFRVHSLTIDQAVQIYPTLLVVSTARCVVESLDTKWQVQMVSKVVVVRLLIDQNYVDGVSITYSNPRQHIWTYAAGVTENSTLSGNCPCSDPRTTQPPECIGGNYYCNPSDMFDNTGFLYSNDKLWDGQQCSYEDTWCSNRSPPWFSVELPSPTSGDIEVYICGNESTDNEDTPIALLNIYIQ